MTPRPPLLGRLFLKLRPLGHRRCDIEADFRELFDERASTFGRRHASWRYLHDAASLWLHRFPDPDIITAPRRRSRGHMQQDIVFALRLFRKQPGLFGLAALGLAVAMGLSTSVFGIVNGNFLRGSGARHPESVFAANLRGGLWLPSSWESPRSDHWQYSYLSQVETSAQTIALSASARDWRELRVDKDGEVLSFSGAGVSGNYFDVLGGTPAVGRVLNMGDDTPSSAPVVVLGYPVWKNRLGSDPQVVGRTVWLGRQAFTVVGVTSAGFTGVGRGDTPPTFWTPIQSLAAARAEDQLASRRARQIQLDQLARKPQPDANDLNTARTLAAELAAKPLPWNPTVRAVGRLQPGASVQRATSELVALAKGVGRSAGQNESQLTLTGVQLSRLDALGFEVLAAATIVLAFVALILLVAAANVTNVLLASAAGRAREIGTRLAIGASRGRVIRQLLTESLILAGAAGLAGFVIALWAIPLLARYLDLEPSYDVSPDWFVFAVALGCSIVVGLAAGLAPARYIRRGDLMSALKTDRLSAPGAIGPGRLRATMIGVQAAGSITLLVIAALFLRSASQTLTRDLGLDAAHLLGVRVSLPMSYDEARTRSFWSAALPTLLAVPGVEAVALASIPPFDGQVAFRVDGHYVHRLQTTSGYFDTVHTAIVRGRAYTDDEVRTGAPVAIISEALARAYWPQEDPIGSALTRVWGPDDRPGDETGLLIKPAGTVVIGVAADAVMNLNNYDALAIYQPLYRNVAGNASVVIRAHGNPAALTGPIQAAVSAIDADPGLTLRAAPVSANIARARTVPVQIMVLTGLIALVALGLATIGLFGVTAFVVGQRHHEVGVRLTLGAHSSDILRMLLGDGLRPVTIGLGCGLVVALIAGRLIQRALYGVTGHDPLAIVGAVLVLLFAATSAILIPARRAARIDPAKMLRES